MSENPPQAQQDQVRVVPTVVRTMGTDVVGQNAKQQQAGQLYDSSAEERFSRSFLSHVPGI